MRIKTWACRLLVAGLLLLSGISVRAQNLTVNGTPTFGAAKFGSGLTAVSDANYLSSATSPWAFSSGQPWTIEAWLSNSATSTLQVCFQLGGNAWVGFYNGHFAFSLPSIGGGSVHTGNNALNDGAFHHCVLQFDGTSNIRMYVDGAIDILVTAAYTQPSGAVAVGNFHPNAGSAWPGSIDEIAVFSGARYSGSTYTVPTAAYTGTETNLVALYHLESDGTNSVVPTLTSAGITASVTTSSAITPQLATISGGTSPYSTVFSYSTTTNGSYTTIGSAVTGATPVATTSASGLTASTTYYFRAVTTDSSGTPIVTTFPSATTGTPLSTSAVGLGAGAITASVTTTTTIKPQLGTITGGTSPYSTVFSYSTTTNGSYSQIGTAVVGANPVASAFATSLTPSTAYYFRAVVTDSAGSPATITLPSGTTGTSLSTNAPTPVTFAFPTTDVAGANLRLSGLWTVGSAGGHNLIRGDGAQSQIDTKVTLTSSTNTISVTTFQLGSSILVSVDGGAFSPVSVPNTGTWGVVAISTNLSAGAHNITMQAIGAMNFDTDYGFTVVDTSPSLSPPDNFGSYYSVQSAPWLTHSRMEGGWYPHSISGYPSGSAYQCDNNNASIQFRTNASQIRIWGYCIANSYDLYRDGVKILGPYTIGDQGNQNKWQLMTIASGLDTSTVHEYQFVGANASQYAGLCTQVMLVGGSGLSTAATYPARDQSAFLGDSITFGTAGTAGDSPLAYVYKFGLDENNGVVNFGHGGWTSADVLTNIANFTALGSTYLKRWFLLIGVNDLLFPPGGMIDANAYATRVTSIVSAMNTAYPGAHGYLINILPVASTYSANTSSANITSFNAKLPAIAAGATNVSVIDISTGPGGTYNPNTVSVDGLHPNTAGYAIITPNLEALVFPPAPIFRRGSGGRAGSRSEVGMNNYGVSPLIIEQLSTEPAYTH
jgi:lysophospholipase L1-like esterase